MTVSQLIYIYMYNKNHQDTRSAKSRSGDLCYIIELHDLIVNIKLEATYCNL